MEYIFFLDMYLGKIVWLYLVIINDVFPSRMLKKNSPLKIPRFFTCHCKTIVRWYNQCKVVERIYSTVSRNLESSINSVLTNWFFWFFSLSYKRTELRKNDDFFWDCKLIKIESKLEKLDELNSSYKNLYLMNQFGKL